ncbi:probable tRNA (guanine(26)-N(2))-dimethyltransferase isoform X1 [Penaeus monodon]|uniref:probable tRNA (guanine(26)-N(2))-dimethyltransferase isoform X1 n=2 Tax=Penaeus monodon TaxID=6687 RepID=UPI0018A79AD3|nr:probable tRNA (guanine(26)-N(2))-dimethyltransferase isoform X1 [Penaeus monodon]XP_037802090.1 probable tRNA (guanine(26)-N(2))-dimethyltransferase isoform X1 [Penaeus monodon]
MLKAVRLRTFGSLLNKFLQYRRVTVSVRMASSEKGSEDTEGGSNGGSEEVGFVIDKRPFTHVQEGKAEVLFPSSHDVFYNPVQEFNRDLSVAVLRVFAAEHKEKENQKRKKAELKEKARLLKLAKDEEEAKNETEVTQDSDKETKAEVPPAEKKFTILEPGKKDPEGIRILEALAASGLRSIRYAHEVGGVMEIVANDFSKQAVECMERNITHNKVEDIVTSSYSDASMAMYKSYEQGKRFHAIDLDPYGSPHAFLDSAVKSVADGGILLVTCTDMAVLCGNSPETCYTKYGALSIKSKACHEIALRIVLQCIESHANRYGRHIVPLLSMSADFYVRVVVQVFTSQYKCKESFSKVSWLYQCVGCETTTLQPLGRVVVNGKSVKYQLSPGPAVSQSCDHCGHRHSVAGPIWNAPIHDKDFIHKLKESLVEDEFTTFRRIYGTLTMMEEELTNVPLYYVVDKLAAVAGINLCKMVQFRSAILNAGYKVSMSHACKNSIKTDAPAQVIWDIVRAWEKSNPANKEKMAPDRPGRRLLEKKSVTEISFEIHPDSNPQSRKQELLRFQVKPEKNWGPKSRAKTSLFHGNQEDKRSRNQGKKRRIQVNAEQLPTKLPKEETDSHVGQETSA